MVKVPADDGIREPSWEAPEEEWIKALTELQDWLQRELDKDGGKEIGYVEYLPGSGSSQVNRCMPPPIGCGKIAISAKTPFNKALIPGHVYSPEGEREIKRISHLCEWCFDSITMEFETPEEAEERREAEAIDEAERQRELRDDDRFVMENEFREQ